MIKAVVIIFVAFFVALMISVWANRDELSVVRVKVGIETNYRPFVFYEQKQAKGISIELLDRIGKKTGIIFEIGMVDELPELIDALKLGKIQVITSLKKTPERKEQIIFTEPYIVVSANLYYFPESVNYPEHIIGVGKGFALEKYLREKYPSSKIVTYSDDNEVFKALVRREITSAAMDELAYRLVLRPETPVIKQPLDFTYELSFALPKEYEYLRNVMNKAIKEIKDDDKNFN